MERLDKVITIISIIVVSILLAGFIWFIFEFKEMLNDYRCSNLPINEFFQDEKCERYWRYRENER